MGNVSEKFPQNLYLGEREISLIWGERGGLWEPVLKGILWEMKGIALIKWVFWGIFGENLFSRKMP